MPMIRFRDLGKLGVVSDALAQDLPVNAFTDAFNVRFEGEKITPIGGWSLVSQGSAHKDETPYCIASLRYTKGEYFVASDKGITAVTPNPHADPSDPSTWDLLTNVTPAGLSFLVPDSARWQETYIANRIVFNSEKYYPVAQTNGASSTEKFSTLAGWGIGTKPTTETVPPADWRCKKMISFSDVLVALNMTESGTNIPNRVRWSNLAYENQLPLDWIADDENTSGGFVDLMEANSPIMDGCTLRDYMMVYTKTQTYMFQFVGGNDVFRNGLLYSDSGILATGCAVEVDGKHIVVTQNDVIIHDGSQKQSIANGVIRERLFKEITSVNPDATRIFKNTEKKEVWITYAYSSQREIDVDQYACNRAAVYNYQYGTWSFAEVPAIYQMTHIMQNERPDVSTWEQSKEGSFVVSDPWDAGTNDLSWDAAAGELATEIMIGCSAQNALFMMDRMKAGYTMIGWSGDNLQIQSIPMVRWVRREYVDLDEVTDEFTRFKTIRNCFPVVESDNSFTFKFSSFRRVGGVEDKRQPIQFDAAHDYQVNTFLTGRWLNYTIESESRGAWNFSGLDFDYVLEGRR